MSIAMYEFLAPWGVLVPVVSAILVYAATSGLRRRLVIRATGQNPSPVGMPPLSLVNG